MVCQIIQDAESNFPANFFTLEEDTEDTAEASNFNWIALSCCSYGMYAAAIDAIREIKDDE